jgi:hypothetical protein
MKLFRRIKSFFTKKEKKQPEIKFGKPDKDGICTLLDENGNPTKVKIQVMSSKMADKLNLITTGYSEKEAEDIIKSRERDKKIEEILKGNIVILFNLLLFIS